MRRELSESEKLLLNKYHEIDSENNKIDNNNNNLKSIKYKNDLFIKEIENKLYDDNFSNTYNNKCNKTNIENILDNNNNENTIYKNSKEIINKYIKSPSQNLKDIDYSQKYNNKSIVNYNFISLTESLLYKTQNIIFPSKIKKKNLKNNSCENIFCFKRQKEEGKDEAPKIINNKNIIDEYFNKDNNEKNKLKNLLKKNKYNLFDINSNKKIGNNLEQKKETKISKINYKKFFFNQKLSSINTQIIKPYKYYSATNANKKIKNKIWNIDKSNINNKTKKKMKNYSQTDINIKKASKIIKGYSYKFNGSNNQNKQEKKENKKSFLQYSSIMSDLIYKNKKYF